LCWRVGAVNEPSATITENFWGPQPTGRGAQAACSSTELELEDGTPADPPNFTAAVPNWKAGDEIPLGRRSLRVVEVREGVLVVAATLKRVEGR